MSLNRTIDRLARAIKREAARNPGFAHKLNAIFEAHTSRRAEFDEIEVEIRAEIGAAAPPAPPARVVTPDLNPVAIVSAQGAETLAVALASEVYTSDALRALAAEHNLDPAGELADADKEAIVAHIVAAAVRRVERDKKLFDY